jgi:catechol 2,3-dioxygenase-like lactoylglutathione lyase family enzyme
MALPARISLVTLGVADVAAATRFYEAIGFERSSASVDGAVSFFATAGGVLAVWGTADLAADAGLAPPPADRFRGVALAINLESRSAVDAAFADVEAAGGLVCKAPVASEWGGYSGYFADPDGNVWEIAHNPHWPLDERGLPQLP